MKRACRLLKISLLRFASVWKKTCAVEAGVFKANSSYNKCAHMENITLELLCHVDYSRPLAASLPAVVWHFQKRLMLGIVLVLNATRLTPLKQQRSPCERPKEDSKFRSNIPTSCAAN